MGYFTEAFDDAYDEVIMEGWGVDADSSTLKKELRWYNKFVKKCKGNVSTIEAIDARLDVLKECSKNMKQTRNNTNGKNFSQRMAYEFKSLIPFNSIARLITKQDLFSTGAGVSGFVGSQVASKVAGRKAASQAASAMASLAGAGDVDAIFGAGTSKTFTDTVAKGAGAIAGAPAAAAVNAGLKVGIRLATFNQMLDRCIKNTDEAIDWLENKKKELKSAK